MTRFLARERETLDRLMPGLDEQLAEVGFETLEKDSSPGIAAFREHGGAGLVVPQDCGGAGASLLDTVRVQRAVGARAPSLCIAATMHHFSVATLVDLCERRAGVEWLVVEAIARQNLLVASGFAEGASERNILHPAVRGVRVDGGYAVSGGKRPCSLTHSMDLLTASASLADTPDGDGRFAVVMIPANSPGLERRAFWQSHLLAAAESDEIVLTDVVVPERLVYFPEGEEALDESGVASYVWFEVLVTAGYLGIVSGLAEIVFAKGKGSPSARAAVVGELEASMAAIEGVAVAQADEDALARALFVRYATQDVLVRASAQAVELLGGLAFISNAEVAYRLACARMLAFHPPPAASSRERLGSYLEGGALRLG